MMRPGDRPPGDITLRIVTRLLAGFVVLLLLGIAAAWVADPVVVSRMGAALTGGSTGVAAPVTGGPPAEVPVARPGKGSIDAKVVEESIAWATENGSHALLVWHNGALEVEHYFPGYDRNTRTPTQSMQKSLLAILVGIAVRDGFIASVDDPAGRYLAEWRDDERGAITIRQLLQQANGLDFPTLDFATGGEFMQIMLGDNLEAVILGQPLATTPGTRFEYTNVGPQVLGIILERATGKRYAEYLSESLWSRIGADDAVVTLDSSARRTARVFCCLDATARSWLQVGLLHLNAGVYNGEQVVPANWMRDVAAPSSTNPNYGYLTWLGTQHVAERSYNSKAGTVARHSEPFAARDVIYFDGFGGQRVYIVPSKSLVIVRTGDIDTGWDDAWLPNRYIRAIS